MDRSRFISSHDKKLCADVLRVVNANPNGITVRGVAAEIGMSGTTPRWIVDDDGYDMDNGDFQSDVKLVALVAKSMCSRGDISSLGPLGDHFYDPSPSAILMPRLTGVPPIEKTELEIFA